jgi:hypothetical protein
MSDQYRPLSKQGVPDPDLDNLQDGLMPWMRAALMEWGGVFWWQGTPMDGVYADESFLTGLEMAMRLRKPLNRSGSQTAALDLTSRMDSDPNFGMDVIGYVVAGLHKFGGFDANERAAHLDYILTESGSVWTVSEAADGEHGRTRYYLTRRDVAAARDAITELRDAASRPSQFLSAAWLRIATREPDPAGAYDNAIKAVEAAAQPVVSPKNGRATLGTMIKDMENKPSKWAFPLDEGNVGVVIAMCKSLWSNHFRHGTQPREDHTLPEADTAVHLAIPLVRYFAGGIVAPVVASE